MRFKQEATLRVQSTLKVAAVGTQFANVLDLPTNTKYDHLLSGIFSCSIALEIAPSWGINGI